MLKLILLCLSIALCLGSQNIVFPTNQAATLVPGVNGANPTLVLAPLNLNDPYQQWNFVGGFISSAAPGYTNYVYDIQQGSSAENTRVILWPKKTPVARNEQWTIDAATGGVKSNITSTKPMYLAAHNGTIVISSASPPAVPAFQTPVTKPWVCYSIGDPHISPYSTGRSDLLIPGSQQPGTYTLSKTGKPGDSYYNLIQADQQLCRPNVPGVYCNQRAIISTQGHVIEIQGNTVTVDGTVVSVTGTYNVGNGVTITKKGNNDYVVNFPQGSMEVIKNSNCCYSYTDIYITTSSGPQPTGGACTKYVGPNPTGARKRDLTPYYFLLSWRAPNRSDDLFQYSSDLAWRLANPLVFNTTNGHFTTNNATLNALAQQACAPLLSNSTLGTQCGAQGVASDDYYQACLDDVIITEDPGYGASITDAYSSKCSAFSNGTVALPTSARGSTAVGNGIGSSIPTGVSQSFLITARNVNGKIVTTGGDAFVLSSTGPASLTFTVVYVGSGNYNVSYIASTAGTYSISVSLNSAPIQNSPFSVQAISASTDPTKSTAAGNGLGLELESGTTLTITVTARTSDGTARTVGGDSVTVAITGFAFIDPVEDNNDGTYTITYEQDSVGTFTITIKINNVEIFGSPFAAKTIY